MVIRATKNVKAMLESDQIIAYACFSTVAAWFPSVSAQTYRIFCLIEFVLHLWHGCLEAEGEVGQR